MVTEPGRFQVPGGMSNLSLMARVSSARREGTEMPKRSGGRCRVNCVPSIPHPPADPVFVVSQSGSVSCAHLADG